MTERRGAAAAVVAPRTALAKSTQLREVVRGCHCFGNAERIREKHNFGMSRRYRKSRRDPGLIEIAATSDWKVSAAMAAVCVLAATVIIPPCSAAAACSAAWC